MAIYNKPNSSSVIVQKDLPIFGLSRLGVYNRSSATSSYEITDHLGNVRAVVDKNAVIKSYADYYPFGEQLPGRNSMSNYRYAFQGQELDTETNMESFQLRLWDGRIGRWLSPDPYGQYASPYLGMGNNPINLTDPDGGSTQCEGCPGKGTTKDPYQLQEVVIRGKSGNSWGDFKFDTYNFLNRADIASDSFGKSFGQFIAGFHPAVALMNAYKGYTGGHDIYGNKMGKGSAAFEGAMAVLPFMKIGKLVPEGKYLLHHIASNKHLSKFTPQYEAIASRFNLKLSAAWNKILITDVHHYSKHPKQYHQFVLDGMEAAAAGAEGNTAKFLELFDKYVIQELIKNPDIVNKTGWK